MSKSVYKFTGIEIINGEWKDAQLETNSVYSYGDFEEYENEITEALRKSLFIIPELFEGSDYSGGSINKSNFRAFLDRFRDVDGVYELQGGYNTYAIAIRLDVSESHQEIKEILKGLEDYSLIDEEDHSELEYEWQEKCMENILRDIINDIDLEEYHLDHDTITEDEEKIERLAWEGIDQLNIDWHIETSSAYIEGEKIIPYIEDKLLLEYCSELPMMVGRDWSCEETKQEFSNKCTGQEAL